jgi:hypothetical protein
LEIEAGGAAMVCVRLAREWTDTAGTAHVAGDAVDIDAVTLAELEAVGVVANAERATAPRDPGDDPQWPGPTDPEGDDPRWPGPTEPEPGDLWPRGG